MADVCFKLAPILRQLSTKKIADLGRGNPRYVETFSKACGIPNQKVVTKVSPSKLLRCIAVQHRAEAQF